MEDFNWRDFLVGTLISLVGVFFIGFGAALSQAMNMGLDPFMALNQGAADAFGFSFGNYQLVVNIIVLIIIAFFDRSLFGWGTVYNMVLVGYITEFFNGWFTTNLPVDELSLIVRLLLTVVAIAFFALGVATYGDADMGVAPYDAITPVLVDKTGIQYRWSRMGQDIVIVIIAWIVGGPVGISTIITGFFAGPLIDFFSDNISQPITEKADLNSESITDQ
jgi:uncharacterized membrane protein YczE